MPDPAAKHLPDFKKPLFAFDIFFLRQGFDVMCGPEKHLQDPDIDVAFFENEELALSVLALGERKKLQELNKVLFQPDAESIPVPLWKNGYRVIYMEV